MNNRNDHSFDCHDLENVLSASIGPIRYLQFNYYMAAEQPAARLPLSCKIGRQKTT